MKQEDKELLLKDLCARLPYGVIVRGVFINYNKDKGKILYEECDKQLNYQDLNRYESLKPYLRPMSSMTEEEQKEFVGFHCVTLCPIIMKDCLTIENECNMFDWLNRHHFDYRGLIEKGLALEAPSGMYEKGE